MRMCWNTCIGTLGVQRWKLDNKCKKKWQKCKKKMYFCTWTILQSWQKAGGANIKNMENTSGLGMTPKGTQDNIHLSQLMAWYSVRWHYPRSRSTILSTCIYLISSDRNLMKHIIKSTFNEIHRMTATPESVLHQELSNVMIPILIDCLSLAFPCTPITSLAFQKVSQSIPMATKTVALCYALVRCIKSSLSFQTTPCDSPGFCRSLANSADHHFGTADLQDLKTATSISLPMLTLPLFPYDEQHCMVYCT